MFGLLYLGLVDYEQLKTVNNNNEHVLETGMNFVVISIPNTESMILKVSFSYQSSTRGNLKHSVTIQLYRCLLILSTQ